MIYLWTLRYRDNSGKSKQVCPIPWGFKANPFLSISEREIFISFLLQNLKSIFFFCIPCPIFEIFLSHQDLKSDSQLNLSHTMFQYQSHHHWCQLPSFLALPLSLICASWELPFPSSKILLRVSPLRGKKGKQALSITVFEENKQLLKEYKCAEVCSCLGCS